MKTDAHRETPAGMPAAAFFTGAPKWENLSGRMKELRSRQTRGMVLQKEGTKGVGGNGSENQTHCSEQGSQTQAFILDDPIYIKS